MKEHRLGSNLITVLIHQWFINQCALDAQKFFLNLIHWLLWIISHLDNWPFSLDICTKDFRTLSRQGKIDFFSPQWITSTRLLSNFRCTRNALYVNYSAEKWESLDVLCKLRFTPLLFNAVVWLLFEMLAICILFHSWYNYPVSIII